MSYLFKNIKSPIGELKLVASAKGLAAILWENDNPMRIKLGEMVEDNKNPILLKTEAQLINYFAGELNIFSIKLDFKGTQFQNEVWQALLTIPYGQTRSYSEIAKLIGNPRAVRAVGVANSKNPIAIIAPCHRVIGSNGSLTGFAGGLKIKEYLLGIESKNSKAA